MLVSEIDLFLAWANSVLALIMFDLAQALLIDSDR